MTTHDPAPREEPLQISMFGSALLKDPVLNKGTAFTVRERHELGLEGLLPPAVESLEQQVARVRVEYRTKQTAIGRHIYLRQLQDVSRVLFYRFLVDNLEEVLPVVYPPPRSAEPANASRGSTDVRTACSSHTRTSTTSTRCSRTRHLRICASSSSPTVNGFSASEIRG